VLDRAIKIAVQAHSGQKEKNGRPYILHPTRLMLKMQNERDYIQRISANPVARKVKLADLEDNLDAKRLPELTMRDQTRMKKYHQAWLLLKGV
jgi:hypothetical protein